MIAISKRNLKKIIKISLLLFLVYTVFYIAFKVFDYYVSYNKLEKLKTQVVQQQKQIDDYKLKSRLKKAQIDKIQKSYASQKQIEEKVRAIFSRMSILNYKLKLLKTNKICLNKYALVVKLSSDEQSGIEAGEKILSYIGKYKRYKDSDIYVVEYNLEAKE